MLPPVPEPVLEALLEPVAGVEPVELVLAPPVPEAEVVPTPRS